MRLPILEQLRRDRTRLIKRIERITRWVNGDLTEDDGRRASDTLARHYSERDIASLNEKLADLDAQIARAESKPRESWATANHARSVSS